MNEYVFRTEEPIEYCYDCPINNSENGRCKLGVATYGLDVPKHCPLKELPPHGRLGDLDKAIDIIHKASEFEKTRAMSGTFSKGIAEGYDKVVKMLKSIEIILEARET